MTSRKIHQRAVGHFYIIVVVNAPELKTPTKALIIRRSLMLECEAVREWVKRRRLPLVVGPVCLASAETCQAPGVDRE